MLLLPAYRLAVFSARRCVPTPNAAKMASASDSDDEFETGELAKVELFRLCHLLIRVASVVTPIELYRIYFC